MFKVVNWKTGNVIETFKNIKRAKRFCRRLGHTGENSPILTGFPPIAYIADEAGNLVYNPRFKKDNG